MASLTGNAVSSTYVSLLKTTDNAAITGALKVITDGTGNATALELSSAGVKSGGTFSVTGATTLVGDAAFGNVTALSVSNTALKVKDTDASHTLAIVPGSNLTNNRTLTIVTGDADRSLSVSGTSTINQDVSTTASPAFVTATTTYPLKHGGTVRCTADFSKTTDTSLADATGLSVTLEAGKKYAINLSLLVDFGNGGVKADFNGTCTATAFIAEGMFYSNGLIVSQARVSALASVFANAVPGSGTTGNVTVSGLITVNTAGTLTVRFAQSSSSGTVSTVKAGSFLSLIECAN